LTVWSLPNFPPVSAYSAVSQVIKEKKILLGVTGGIAAYKSVELLRLFQKEGAQVRVVMTANAARFVTALTFRAISGFPVITDIFDAETESGIDHIGLTDWADLFVIAPATANIIGKMAAGLGDDSLSTMALAFDGDFLLAPAMNTKMFQNRIVQENIKKLQNLDYHFIGPAWGALACRDEGAGRMSEPVQILEAAIPLLSDKDLAGKKIVLTAGPTVEDIDPVRFISNRSSGKMGYAIAREASRRGAEVMLISGPSSLEPPSGCNFKSVRTSGEMHNALLATAKGADALIMAAAVADYKPVKKSEQKIKKKAERLLLELTKNTDILGDLSGKGLSKLIVGFAAETENIVENALKKVKEKKLDLIIANDISEKGAGFDTDTNRVQIMDKSGVIEKTELLTKRGIANIILNRIKERFN